MAGLQHLANKMAAALELSLPKTLLTVLSLPMYHSEMP
jgi:hypothetical protein